MRLNNHENDCEIKQRTQSLLDLGWVRIKNNPTQAVVNKNEERLHFTKELERQEVEVVDLDKLQGQEVRAVVNVQSESRARCLQVGHKLFTDIGVCERNFSHSTGWKSCSLPVRGFSDKVTFASRYVDGSGQSPAIFAIKAGACGTQCCHLCQLCVLPSHNFPHFSSEEFSGNI